MNLASPFVSATLVIAAVRVVLPWSTWPIVPTLTCGLVRSNFCLAIGVFVPPQCAMSISGAHRDMIRSPANRAFGAHVGTRTRDLLFTKEVLYLLSYMGTQKSGARIQYPEAALSMSGLLLAPGF